MAQVPIILQSFGKSPGFGNSLKDLLPREHEPSADAVAAFLLFILERQKTWGNKRKNRKTLTTNRVLATKWFTNMYRELDRGTLYFRYCMSKTDLKGVKISKDTIETDLVTKVLFKSIVYRLINKVETFMDFGGIPNQDEFPAFLSYLKAKVREKVVIFTAAHQNMGFRRLMDTFSYLAKNIDKLTYNVVKGANHRSTKECQEAILKIPNVGAFFAWQILCDLLECKILGDNTDNQWACLGPGAKNGLRRIFRLETTKGELKHTRLLRDLGGLRGPTSGFKALGLEFPAFLHKPLSLKNIEHALCEYDKYFRFNLNSQVRERDYSDQKSRKHLDKQSLCEICSYEASEADCVKCLLCGTIYHKPCETNWGTMFHRDGSWLCHVCHEIEQAWAEEDFDFEEPDSNDNINKKWMSGEEKSKLAKSCRVKRLAKQGKTVKKNKKARNAAASVECIDLSSDDEDLNEGDESDNEGDESDEIMFIEEHFFGPDSSSPNVDDHHPEDILGL